ncbi:MAG: hypothetical protein WDZ40_01445 [Candidatus Spechtbacterales bacterium]
MIKNKKIPYALFTILAVVSVVFLFQKYFIISKHTTVELRNDGFYPKEVTVKIGEEVRFVNKRDRSFWPASNLHPTHAIYPEFDPGEPVGAGETWSFVFEVPGIWNYHDHLAPSFVGRIVVLDEGAATAAKDACEENLNSQKCWDLRLAQALEEEGLDASLDLLGELYKSNTQFAHSCHAMAHNIGILAYNLYLDDPESVLSNKAYSCANGFFHGFMEAVITIDGDISTAADVCAYFGEKLSKDVPDAQYQCHHGIGHGILDLASASNNYLSDEAALVGFALPLCEATSSNEEQLFRCASGVFNGVANMYIEGSQGFAINESDPIWLCHNQKEEYKRSCYGNMNSLLLWISDNDFKKALSYTKNIQDNKQLAVAVKYLAAIAMLYKDKNEPLEVVRECDTFSPELASTCIEGVVDGILEHGTPGLEAEEGIEFCESVKGLRNIQTMCFESLFRIVHGLYSAEKANHVCQNVSEEYQEVCYR